MLHRGGRVVRLMIIGDHYRICKGLSNEFIPMVLDCEDDLESHLLVLMSAIASNPHR